MKDYTEFDEKPFVGEFQNRFDAMRDNILNQLEENCKAFLISKGWDGKDMNQAQEIASKYEKHIVCKDREPNKVVFEVQFEEKDLKGKQNTLEKQ